MKRQNETCQKGMLGPQSYREINQDLVFQLSVLAHWFLHLPAAPDYSKWKPQENIKIAMSRNGLENDWAGAALNCWVFHRSESHDLSPDSRLLSLNPTSSSSAFAMVQPFLASVGCAEFCFACMASELQARESWLYNHDIILWKHASAPKSWALKPYCNVSPGKRTLLL